MNATELLVREALTRGDNVAVPYRLLLEAYRERLRQEHDMDRRLEIELSICMLMGLLEVQQELEALKLRLSREG